MSISTRRFSRSSALGSSGGSTRFMGQGRPWALNSPWNTPTPGNTTWYDTPSLHNVPSTGDQTMYWIGRSVNIFYAALSDPIWTLNLPADAGWPAGNRQAKAARTVQIHAPESVYISAQDGGDGVIVLVDGTQYYETWLSLINDVTHTIDCTAWWDGDIVSGLGVGVGDRPAGVRAANFSWAGGAITGWDLAQGKIDHALAILLADEQLDSTPPLPPYRWPATCADNGGHAPGPIQCGSKIGIPTGVARPSGLSTIGIMIFDALQKYGGYVGDYVGGGWPFITAEALTTTDADFSQFFDPWSNGGYADYMSLAPLLRVADYQP